MLLIFILWTVLSFAWMIYNVLVGMATKDDVIERYYGGEEAMSKLSDAKLERPYFAYLNEKYDNATGKIVKFWWWLNNAFGFCLLWIAVRWHWGIVATVRLVLTFAWWVVSVIVCGVLYWRWHKIASKKPDFEADKREVFEKMAKERAALEEKKERDEAKRQEEVKKGNTNVMTPEERDAYAEAQSKTAQARRAAAALKNKKE